MASGLGTLITDATRTVYGVPFFGVNIAGEIMITTRFTCTVRLGTNKRLWLRLRLFLRVLLGTPFTPTHNDAVIKP